MTERQKGNTKVGSVRHYVIEGDTRAAGAPLALAGASVSGPGAHAALRVRTGTFAVVAERRHTSVGFACALEKELTR
jgi:hypothetical protein